MDIFKFKPKTMVFKHLVVILFLHQSQLHPINNKKIKYILYKIFLDCEFKQRKEGTQVCN